MNNPNSPLVPQGSFLEQQSKGRTRVRIAVLFVLAIHVVGLMALLMQGCRRQEEIPPPEPPPEQVDTNPVFDPTNAGMDMIWTNTATTTTLAPPPDTTTTAIASPIGGMTPLTTEYIVAAGDNFTTIGQKFGVSARAIQDANPTVDPRRLQIGSRLQIPPPSSTAMGAATTTTASPAGANGEVIYTVVSGDNLTKIATKYNTTVRALREANNLTTDRIRVGDKLKIPQSGQ